MAAKRDLVKKGQAHRKFRKDPADHPTDGQDRPPRDRPLRVTGLRMRADTERRKREQSAASGTAKLPDDTRSVVRRLRSLSERRVTSCTVDLGAVRYALPPSRASERRLAAAHAENFGEWYTPEATHVLEPGTASDAEHLERPKHSSSEGE